MKTAIKIFLISIISFAVLYIGTIIVIIFFAFGGDGMCGNEMIQSIIAPGKNTTAYAFSRNCGATTSFSYQLSIYKYTDTLTLPSEKGNIFISDTPFTFEWASKDKLKITYKKNSEISKQEKKRDGIRIVYSVK